MTGRFLTVPFLAATLRIIRRLAVARSWIPVAVGVCGLVIGAVSPTPAFLGNFNYTWGESLNLAISRESEISDERRFYWQLTGLLSPNRTGADPSFRRLGEQAHRDGVRLAMRAAVGMYGFFGGPELYLIDVYGLGDPLLARLTPIARWRIDHYRRDVPAGYWQTLASGQNMIQSPGIRVFYDHLTVITRAPIWSRRRFREIFRMNLGKYDYLLTPQFNQALQNKSQ